MTDVEMKTAERETKELTEKEKEEQEDILRRIEHTINKIRPYIMADGGDVQLVGYEDGVVTVSMLGACAGCMAIDTTLTDGIEALLIDEVPEVKKVQLYQSAPYPYYY
jgi:Fe-S cluster biogenesis protein NfuA